MAARESGEKQIFGVTVAVVAVVLVVVGVFTFLSYRKLSNIRKETRDLTRKIEDHDKVIAEKPRLENELRASQARFDNVRTYLPDDRDVDGLIEALRSKCLEANLTFSKLDRVASPGAAAGRKAQGKDVEEILFKGEFAGSYHSLAKFVSMVEDWEHFKRFVSITDFSVDAGEKGLAYDTGAQRHEVSMTLELYKYAEAKTPATGPATPATPPGTAKPAGAGSGTASQ